MRLLNKSWGYEEVDQRIAAVVQQLRVSRDCRLIARWYSGDEFIYNCPSSDAMQAAERIKQLFDQQGINVTIGIVPIQAGDWRQAVKSALGLVQQAKAQGRLGTIHRYDSRVSTAFESGDLKPRSEVNGLKPRT